MSLHLRQKCGKSYQEQVLFRPLRAEMPTILATLQLSNWATNYFPAAIFFLAENSLGGITLFNHNFLQSMDHEAPPWTKMWEKLPGTSLVQNPWARNACKSCYTSATFPIWPLPILPWQIFFLLNRPWEVVLGSNVRARTTGRIFYVRTTASKTRNTTLTTHSPGCSS